MIGFGTLAFGTSGVVNKAFVGLICNHTMVGMVIDEARKKMSRKNARDNG